MRRTPARPRPGHLELARDRLRRARPHRRDRAARVPPDLPEARLGRARPARDLGLAAGDRARGARQGRPPASRHRRRRHHQPARDDHRLEPHHRRADPQRHRLAGPAHRAGLRRAKRSRRAASSRSFASAPASSSTPTSPAPSSPGCSTTSPARAAPPARGELAFGTVDTWLLWKLTGGRVHATDPSNASRTLLFDVPRGAWSDELLPALDVPREVLPEVHPSSHVFGHTSADLLGAPIAIGGVAGDQQSALFGQACFRPAWPRTPTAPAASC